jgi:hypothetical protein
MSEAAEEYVIEVEAGLGDPPYIVFAKGAVLNPMSVGRRGMWRIDAEDVLDVHAYVYYDGRILFLQSADEEAPLVVGGRAIPRGWTATAIPCEVAMGRARLHVRAQYTELESLSDQQTVAAHKPPVERPFPPGAFSARRSRDSESTRQHPLDMTAAVGIGRPPPPMTSFSRVSAQW